MVIELPTGTMPLSEVVVTHVLSSPLSRWTSGRSLSEKLSTAFPMLAAVTLNARLLPGSTARGNSLMFSAHERSGAAATGTSTLSETLPFCRDVAVRRRPKVSMAGTSPSTTTDMVRNEDPPCATFFVGVGVDHDTLPAVGAGSSEATKA